VSAQADLEFLRGRLLAFEAVLVVLWADYAGRNPTAAAILTAYLQQNLAVNRLAAEMLSDDALRGFREALEDFIQRTSLGGGHGEDGGDA